MTEIIRITGLARHPDSLEHIVEHIKNSTNYEVEKFNTDLVNFIGHWSNQAETRFTLPMLTLSGLGKISTPRMVSYGVVDKKLKIIEELDDAIPTRSYFGEVIKTKLESNLGLIFHSEGDYSDGNNVGIWVPEHDVPKLDIQVHVISKIKE